jgi:hypothetical protein
MEIFFFLALVVALLAMHLTKDGQSHDTVFKPIVKCIKFLSLVVEAGSMEPAALIASMTRMANACPAPSAKCLESRSNWRDMTCRVDDRLITPPLLPHPHRQLVIHSHLDLKLKQFF